MFGLSKKRERLLSSRVEQLEERVIALSEIRNELTDENATLTSDNKKLSQKKQMGDEMIAHKLKMREEQVELDANKRVATAEQKASKKSNDEIAAVKDTYRDKLESQLEKRGDEMKEIQIEILSRLPDVSMAITKEIKEKSK